MLVAILLAPAAAHATFPGSNGLLTFTRVVGPDSDVWLMDPDGQNQSVLAGGAGNRDLESSFSADGEQVAFARDLPTGGTAIMVMGVDGSDPHPVAFDGGSFPFPHFSPDGKRLVYGTLTGGNEDIAIIDVDGQNRQLLTSGPAREFEASFSPDGSRIVFQRSDGTGINIWTMDPDGQNQTQLTTGQPDDSSPSFSPDGSRIVFVQAPPGDQPGDIAVMGPAGQSPQPLTNTPTVHDGGPVFSPDGQRIAFSQAPSGGGPDGEIVVMDAGGQNQVAVTQNSDFDNQVDWQALNPPQCSLTGESKSKNLKEISLTLVCANENAAVSASGEMTVKTRRKRGAAASKKKVVPIDPVGTQLQESVPTPLTLAIPKKARKAIKRSGKAGNAVVNVTVTDDLGETAALAHAAKVKPKRKKRRG